MALELSPPRILLADSSAARRKRVEDWLSERGYPNHSLDNGRRALEALRTTSEQPATELLVSALDPKGVNGLQLAQTLDEFPELRQLPVILYGEADDDLPAARGQVSAQGGERRLWVVSLAALFDALTTYTVVMGRPVGSPIARLRGF